MTPNVNCSRVRAECQPSLTQALLMNPGKKYQKRHDVGMVFKNKPKDHRNM